MAGGDVYEYENLFEGTPLEEVILQKGVDKGLEQGMKQGLEQGIEQGLQVRVQLW